MMVNKRAKPAIMLLNMWLIIAVKIMLQKVLDLSTSSLVYPCISWLIFTLIAAVDSKDAEQVR